MKAMNELRKRKAISPVIATVILVAVAITVSVAVSYWMGSIASQYTKFEKVEIQSGYATVGGNGWTITLDLKNSGSATANLIKVFVNDVPVSVGSTLSPGIMTSNIPSTGLVILSGKSAPVEVYIGTGLFSSGTTINIKLHSAGGMDYIKLIELV
jgi:flagellin-like protein